MATMEFSLAQVAQANWNLHVRLAARCWLLPGRPSGDRSWGQVGESSAGIRALRGRGSPSAPRRPPLAGFETSRLRKLRKFRRNLCGRALGAHAAPRFVHGGAGHEKKYFPKPARECRRLPRRRLRPRRCRRARAEARSWPRPCPGRDRSGRRSSPPRRRPRALPPRARARWASPPPG
jgi:hypothetical protein